MYSVRSFLWAVILTCAGYFTPIAGICSHNSPVLRVSAGCGPEEDGGWERPDPEGVQPLLRPDHRQRQPGQGLRDVTGRRGQTVQWTPVGPGELGVLRTSCSALTDHSERVTLTHQHVCVCVCVFLTTKAKEEKRAEILNNYKKTNTVRSLGPARRATFFYSKLKGKECLFIL